MNTTDTPALTCLGTDVSSCTREVSLCTPDTLPFFLFPKGPAFFLWAPGPPYLCQMYPLSSCLGAAWMTPLDLGASAQMALPARRLPHELQAWCSSPFPPTLLFPFRAVGNYFIFIPF